MASQTALAPLGGPSWGQSRPAMNPAKPPPAPPDPDPGDGIGTTRRYVTYRVRSNHVTPFTSTVGHSSSPGNGALVYSIGPWVYHTYRPPQTQHHPLLEGGVGS